jgi:hypothetical protein
MFGLAAIAAVAAMAFVGASSAMAESTLLCTTDTPALAPSAAECTQPTELHYLSVDAAGNPAKIIWLNSLVNVECNALLLAILLPGLKTNAPADLHIAAANLQYTNCSPCTVTTEAGGLLLILKLKNSGLELGDVTVDGLKVKVVCLGFIKCVYNSANLVGHFLGPLATGGNDHITYTANEVTSESGGLCPEKALLHALFRDLTKTYIRN